MLNGKKIIITRQAGSGDPIVDALHELGAEVIFMPLIEVFPIASVDELSKNHQKIENYQWLLFTSKNGVQFFFNAYKLEGSKLPFKTGVFGNSTAQALKNLGLTPDLVNNGTSSADLLAEILPKLNKTDKVLLVLGNLASDLLQDGLRQVVKTDRLDIYRTEFVTSISPEITERIIQGQYDLLLFSSPSCLASFKAHLHGRVNLGTLKTACLGPTTEEALLAEGITPLVVAQPSSADGLITAIKKYYKLPLAAQTVSLSK